jgi:glycosyltransferase involved in cell wall biosynthesis
VTLPGVKILYLCTDLGIPILGQHGAAVHIRNLVAAFERAGHKTILAAPLLNKSPWERSATVAATLLHVPPTTDTTAAVSGLKAFIHTLGASNSLPGEVRRILYNKDLARHIRGHFNDHPPDFIYERASLYSTAGIEIARELDRPIVIELNAPPALEHTTYRGSCIQQLAAEVERWTLMQAQLVFAVSAELRNYVIGLGVDPNRIHVLPNGVDSALFHPKSLLANGSDRKTPVSRQDWVNSERSPSIETDAKPAEIDGGPVLGFVGGLRRWHGVEILPQLIERLRTRHPRIRMVIVGDGPLRGDLEHAFDEYGLSERVRFTGAICHDDVPDCIRQFNVALAPYSRPTHSFYFSPLKLFEYMACGVPTVAARLGQIEEIVRHGETGLLYRPGDLDELVAACDRLLTDKGLRHKLGRSAAEQIHGHYTWDHNVSRIVELVRALSSM